MGDWLLMCQLIWSFDIPPIPPTWLGNPQTFDCPSGKGDGEFNPTGSVKYFQENELVLLSYMEVFIDKEFSCACE